MKIAILYYSKYGNTKTVAEFLVKKVQAEGHEGKLFNVKKSKPSELFTFKPDAILAGTPTHFGKPVRSFSKYIQKLGKDSTSSIQKAAVFNCYTGDDVCSIIQNQITEVLPHIEIFEGTLPIRTGGENGELWKKVALQKNWKDAASSFLSEFLNF